MSNLSGREARQRPTAKALGPYLKRAVRIVLKLIGKGAAIALRTIGARDAVVRSVNNELRKKKRTIRRLRPLNEAYRRMAGLSQVTNFAQICHRQNARLDADVYIAHDVLALPAVQTLSRLSGGRRVCDVIEIPGFAERTLQPSWHPTTREMLEHMAEAYLQHCDSLLAIGPTLGSRVSGLGPPVHVIPNYRYSETPTRSRELRDWCGVREDESLVLVISTIASGFAEVLDALASLPEDVHLAMLGRIVPESYRQEMLDRIQALGLRSRIHLFDMVPYDDLARIASGADIGLIVRDPALANNYVSLPNRVFDYLASGLPICSPAIPDIVEILQQHDCGTVVNTLDRSGWATAIQHTLANNQHQRRNAAAAAETMNWESLEERLVDALGNPASATFLAINKLHTNNRTRRMAVSLARKGASVTIASHNIPDDLESPHQNVRYVSIPLEMPDT